VQILYGIAMKRNNILNIIFDLGGVVFTWEPDKLIADTIDNKDIHHLIKEGIINHSDWVDLDRGTLSEDEAVKRGSMRTGLPESQIKRLMRAMPLSLTPINESVKLIEDLKKNHNKLYILSNMHHSSINHLENKYFIWDLFDGKVISCRVNKVKPEYEIYQHLLDNYHLIISDTVFIDDVDVNLKAAADLGIKTIKFENPFQCRGELVKLGCLS